MTDNEITLFRRFLTDKGTMNNFEYFYNNHRLTRVTFDKYLETVDAEDVILNAFDMSAGINTIFNFQYWKKLDEKWQRKLQDFRETGKIDVPEQKIYCPHCKRLMPKSSFIFNAKGQLHKHCRECESGEWDRQKREKEKAVKEQEQLEKQARQLEKEIGEKQAKLQRLTGEAVTVDMQREKEIERALNYAAQVSDKEIPEPINTATTTRNMDDFTFFDFDKKSTKTSIGDNQFVINNKKGNYSIVINMADSKKIIDAGLLRLRLRKDNITGALHLVFNADNGATCRTKSVHCVAINNKDMVQFLVKTLGYRITDERILVDISENLSRTKGYITFLIKKTKK